MKRVYVVAAVIFFENKILCVQRKKSELLYISEKFEFPGGKIEIGETNEEALLRELHEELEISVTIESLFIKVVHQYPDFELTMQSYICQAQSQLVKLNEHISFEWLKLEELEKLDWAEADIPIVKKLVSNG